MPRGAGNSPKFARPKEAGPSPPPPLCRSPVQSTRPIVREATCVESDARHQCALPTPVHLPHLHPGRVPCGRANAPCCGDGAGAIHAPSCALVRASTRAPTPTHANPNSRNIAPKTLGSLPCMRHGGYSTCKAPVLGGPCWSEISWVGPTYMHPPILPTSPPMSLPHRTSQRSPV